MIEEKEVKTWWAYLYNNEEYDDDSIVVGELLDHHPKQGPLHWQAGLFEVVQKSEFDSQSQLIKEKDARIEELEKKKRNTDIAILGKEDAFKEILEEKDAEIARLRVALRFYAYNEHWHGSIALDECILRDSGAKARKALAKGDGSGS